MIVQANAADFCISSFLIIIVRQKTSRTLYILTSFLLMYLLKLVYVVVEVFLFSCVISWVKFNFRLLVIRKNHCKLVNVLAEDAASQASGSS